MLLTEFLALEVSILRKVFSLKSFQIAKKCANGKKISSGSSGFSKPQLEEGKYKTFNTFLWIHTQTHARVKAAFVTYTFFNSYFLMLHYGGFSGTMENTQ